MIQLNQFEISKCNKLWFPSTCILAVLGLPSVDLLDLATNIIDVPSMVDCSIGGNIHDQKQLYADKQGSLSPYESCPPWTGVYCNDVGNVVTVTLDGFGLSGELKLNTLTGLIALQNLSLANNDFSGQVPPGLGAMSSLKYLDLSQNQFYGPIPARITDLWGLNYLNLSRNLFRRTRFFRY
ncbi:hypothetical protein ACLB2K_002078 [Fragaria x ananassa]